MAPELLVERLHIAAAIALLMIGVVTAWSAANAIKRLAGVLIAFTATLLAFAAIAAPAALLIAAIAVAFATLVVAVALLVRLQEAYGGIDTPEFDRADAQSEIAGPTS